MPDTSLRDLKDGLRQIRTEFDDLKETFAAGYRAAACREREYQLAARRFETALIRYADACRKAGFNPNQPRMPAGNPQGGQWTGDGSTSRIGGGITSDVRLADAGGASVVMSDAIPDPIVPGTQYAQIYVRRNDMAIHKLTARLKLSCRLCCVHTLLLEKVLVQPTEF